MCTAAVRRYIDFYCSVDCDVILISVWGQEYRQAQAVASPGFGARRGTCKSCWVFTGGNCRHI